MTPKVIPLKDSVWGRLRELAKENSDVADVMVMVNQLSDALDIAERRERANFKSYEEESERRDQFEAEVGKLTDQLLWMETFHKYAKDIIRQSEYDEIRLLVEMERLNFPGLGEKI